MQTKRLTLFPRPVDRDAFHHDYETAYIEAAERLPGLLSWRCTVPRRRMAWRSSCAAPGW